MTRECAPELKSGRVKEIYKTLKEMAEHVPLKEYSEARCSLMVWVRAEEKLPTNRIVQYVTSDTRYTFEVTVRQADSTSLPRIVEVILERHEARSRGPLDELKVRGSASIDEPVKRRGRSLVDVLKIALRHLREYDEERDWNVRKVTNKFREIVRRITSSGPDEPGILEMEDSKVGTEYDGLFEYWVALKSGSIALSAVRRVLEVDRKLSLYGVHVEVPDARW
ncbi:MULTISPECIES: hypothetical protein [unclassified Methanopyrus]|uniref:hypothetical protein n=1 Tax=Methanopyrus sp. SNP6 TaxID=1937005 RepID=UPI0011E5F605|nr:hypothetical protein [Methanopyrus sp. SNP6]